MVQLSGQLFAHRLNSIIKIQKTMILNIVKNGTDSSSILECVKKTFNSSKVNIKTDYEISVDIEVIGEGGLHSLEGIKELEYYFRDYDIRVW